jgi:hypothetical protein
MSEWNSIIKVIYEIRSLFKSENINLYSNRSGDLHWQAFNLPFFRSGNKTRTRAVQTSRKMFLMSGLGIPSLFRNNVRIKA